MKQFEIVWAKVNGRYSQREQFYSRKLAVLYLNMLTLDYGVVDARLRRCATP